MTTRRVFGTIHDSRDMPWANQRVTFVLRVGSFTSATQYPRKRVEATTNSVGYFEVDLWANSDGLLPTTYQCKLPDADEFDFRLSNGIAPINLSELRGLGGISTQVPQTLFEQLQPYFLSQSQGDGRYRKLTDTIAFSDLTGVAADGQIPASIARIDDVITRIAQHAAAADPHPQYLTPAEGAALFAPAGAPSATNLSIVNRTATTIDIASDTGQDATIPGASTTLSGVMSAADKAKLDNIAPGAQVNTVVSVAGKTGVITLAKADLGLASVDNTADADKPVSTATATALAARELTAARTLTPTPTDPGNTATINGFLSWLISAMRGAQTTLGGLGALANKSTIANVDVAAGAAIDWSKISKSGAVPADVGAATAAQGALATTALQPASSLDATKLTGTVPIGSIPAAIATDAEVSAAIAAVTTTSIGADIAGAKTLTPTATDPGNTATNSGFLSWLISAMRSAQTTLSGLGTLATKSTIVSADITDGTITNADISATAAIVASKLSGVQPLSSRLTGFDGLAGPGLVQLPSGAGSPTIAPETAAGLSLRTATDAAAVRSAAELGRLAPSTGGMALHPGGSGAHYVSPYALSVQTNSPAAWIEILNWNGAGLGAFFGVNSDNGFEQYNWAGQAIRFFTGASVNTATHGWIFANNGHTTLPGMVAPKIYTAATLPSAALLSGGICLRNNAGSTIPVYSDGTNWRKFSDDTIV
jgi:hypothetical protein